MELRDVKPLSGDLSEAQALALGKMDTLTAIAAVQGESLRELAGDRTTTGQAFEPLHSNSFTLPMDAGMPAADALTVARGAALTGLKAGDLAAAQALDRAGRLQVIVDVQDATELLERWPDDAAALTPTKLVLAVPAEDLFALAEDAAVNRIEASVALTPQLDEAHRFSRLIGEDGSRLSALTGANVLVGIVDSGIDGSHVDFWDGARSRIVDYLDQTGGRHVGATADGRIAPDEARGCTDEIGHGTHVAGIAAGNGAADARYAGVAPDADLAIVKTTLKSTDIARAVSHVFAVAERRSQPCVVNLSLGGHAGGHDGSTLTERVIDELCDGPGRIVVTAAGNAGSDRVHSSVQFSELAPGRSGKRRWVADLEVLARIERGKIVGSAFLQVWTQREDDLVVAIRTPLGELLRPAPMNRSTVRRDAYMLETWHEVSSFSGDTVTSFSLGVVPATRYLEGWSVIVEESAPGGARLGVAHAWIAGGGARFNASAVRSHLVGMPGTAFSAITVASYGARRSWPAAGEVTMDAVNLDDISYFSSRGPTRDGHNKPEIAAPGQWVVAPRSAQAALPDFMHVDGGPYAAMQGTSMAAPYVTGALALLLEREPMLTWAEAKRRLIKSARQDGFTRGAWNPAWGYGKLDVQRLLQVSA